MFKAIVKKTARKRLAFLLAFLLAFSPIFAFTSSPVYSDQDQLISETQLELYEPDEAGASDVSEMVYPIDEFEAHDVSDANDDNSGATDTANSVDGAYDANDLSDPDYASAVLSVEYLNDSEDAENTENTDDAEALDADADADAMPETEELPDSDEETVFNDGEDLPAVKLATGVSAAISVSAPNADTIASGGELHAKPGEMITMKLTLTATGGDAFGFAAGLLVNSSAVSFIDDDFEKDNPEIEIAETVSGNAKYIWLSHDSNGEDTFLKEDVPFVITLQFKFPNMTANNASLMFGTSMQNTRIQLLVSPDLRLDELRDESGAFLASNNFSQETLNKTVSYPSQVWCRVYVDAAATVSISAKNESNVGAKIGESVKTVFTITPEKDAYGFVVHIQYQTGQNQFLELDTSSWKTDNPAIPLAELVNGGVVRIKAESDGVTKILKAGEPFDIIVSFKVINTIATYTPIYSDLVGCVLTDPTVRVAELFTGDTASVWQENVAKAETDGKADVVNSIQSYPGFQITGAYVASIEFGKASGVAGIGSPAIEVSAVITPPTGKTLYGFSAGVNYFGYYFTLDEAATKARNAELGLSIGFFESEYTETTYTWQPSMQQIYVESNGVKLADAGKTLRFVLVFRPKSTNAIDGSAITAITALNGNRVVLFTDPSVRAIEEGVGLTTIFFGMSRIQAAEKVGLIAIANPIAGSITTAKQLELDTDGVAYTLRSAENFQTFANAVNSGLTGIKGVVSGTVTLSDNFTGIGTAENPFRGELSGGTVVVNRTVSGGANMVVGGIVNYLGSGGAVANMTVNGAVTVSGVTGTANIGGVVGISDGGSLSYITGDVNVTATGVSGNVGGIAGSVSKSRYAGISTSYYYTAYGCKNRGTVSGGTNTGGIVGVFNGERGDTTNLNTMYFCANTGAVSGAMNAGGIVGSITYGIIRQCRNTDIIYTNTSTGWAYVSSPGGDISGARAGGIAGIATDAMLDNCSSFDNTVSGQTGAGGIVGRITGETTVDSCWVNAGIVTSPGSAAGGIIGEASSASARITNNFNIGTESKNGITGAASATPMQYGGNCYIATAADGDALNAIRVSDPGLFIVVTAGSSNAIGRYAYDAPGEPECDESGVWLLKTPEDILWLARKVSANTVNNASIEGTGDDVEYDYSRMSLRLMNDIDMSGQSFFGIGMNTPNTAYFKGSFDGNGHTVTLNVTSTPNNFFGFFNYVEGAMIKDLTIDGQINLPSTNVVAAIVANNTNQGILIIENCHNKARITAPTAGTVGGIVGNGMDIRIANCTNSAAIMQNPTSTGGTVGGIAGSIAGDSIVDNCKNTGAVTGGSQIGGIVGTVNINGIKRSIVVKNCENTGNITSNTPASTNFTSTYCAGGIVGYVNTQTAGNGATGPDEVSKFTVSGCENSGTISGTTNHLAGILARTTSGQPVALSISGCINYGDVISTFSRTDESYGNSITVGGIGGSFNLGFMPDWGDDGHYGTVSGNENHGKVSGKFGSISSIVGSGEGNIRDVSGNDTSVINSAKDQNAINSGMLKVIDPPKPPDDGNPVIRPPNDGGDNYDIGNNNGNTNGNANAGGTNNPGSSAGDSETSLPTPQVPTAPTPITPVTDDTTSGASDVTELNNNPAPTTQYRPVSRNPAQTEPIVLELDDTKPPLASQPSQNESTAQDESTPPEDASPPQDDDTPIEELQVPLAADVVIDPTGINPAFIIIPLIAVIVIVGAIGFIRFRRKTSAG